MKIEQKTLFWAKSWIIPSWKNSPNQPHPFVNHCKISQKKPVGILKNTCIEYGLN